MAGDERGQEREQRPQVGREVDVHVGEHLGVAPRPGGAQGAAAAGAVEMQGLDARQLSREPFGDRGRRVARVVVGDRDPPGERQLVAAERVEAGDRALERGGLVADGHDELDLRRRRGRRGHEGRGLGDGGGGGHVLQARRRAWARARTGLGVA